ncbi:CybS-domain-containing protein [Plectosphaerella cucumerina]|uniref:Succinate dehydrogenase [ubiquinone] cytochrome b small subunit n=1 Tax=Plectosphaerella cucumerina TaxID=40658 RepID=A0A8K0TSH3_9PEZI|nr:CybS-domain-containing protein [Plectosphaerella cucumerina]
MASIMRPGLLRQSAIAARMARTPAIRATAFHTTSKRQLLPAGPQVIQGTVNDPVTVPEPSPSHGSYHWTFERVLAAGLVPLTIAPFAAGSLNPVMDAILGASILVHSHMGIQAVFVDYVSTRTYPRLRKFVMWSLNAATALVGLGLYEFETNDVGITEAIKRVWTA